MQKKRKTKIGEEEEEVNAKRPYIKKKQTNLQAGKKKMMAKSRNI